MSRERGAFQVSRLKAFVASRTKTARGFASRNVPPPCMEDCISSCDDCSGVRSLDKCIRIISGGWEGTAPNGFDLSRFNSPSRSGMIVLQNSGGCIWDSTTNFAPGHVQLRFFDEEEEDTPCGNCWVLYFMADRTQPASYYAAFWDFDRDPCHPTWSFENESPQCWTLAAWENLPEGLPIPCAFDATTHNRNTEGAPCNDQPCNKELCGFELILAGWGGSGTFFRISNGVTTALWDLSPLNGIWHNPGVFGSGLPTYRSVFSLGGLIGNQTTFPIDCSNMPSGIPNKPGFLLAKCCRRFQGFILDDSTVNPYITGGGSKSISGWADIAFHGDLTMLDHGLPVGQAGTAINHFLHLHMPIKNANNVTIDIRHANQIITRRGSLEGNLLKLNCVDVCEFTSRRGIAAIPEWNDVKIEGEYELPVTYEPNKWRKSSGPFDKDGLNDIDTDFTGEPVIGTAQLRPIFGGIMGT